MVRLRLALKPVRNVVLSLSVLSLIACGRGIVPTPISAADVSNTNSTSPLLSATSTSSYKSAVLLDAPAVYYRLDEKSASPVTDSSGNSRTGNYLGSIGYNATGALTGDTDSAILFNGSSGHALGYVPGVRSAYSLETWFKTGSSLPQQMLDLYPQQLIIQGGRVGFGSGTVFVQSPGSSYDDNKYHHVVASYDGRSRYLYIDGGLVASGSSATGSVSSNWLNIAHYYGGGQLFNGSLDEVAVYPRSLNSSQVASHYNAGLSGSHAGVVPKHVLTADYYSGTIGTGLAPALIAPWVNWAETTWQSNPSLRAAGIKVMYYTDPNRQDPTGNMYSSVESTFAHTCSGARITTAGYSNLYLMNPASTVLRSLWKAFIASRSVGVHWDAIFEDNANDLNATSALPCNYSASAWLAAAQGLNGSQSPTPIIYNGLQLDNQMQLNQTSNVLGGMEEGCYSASDSRPKIWDPYWTQIENTELAMAQQNKVFMCLGIDSISAASSTSIDSRRFTYASFLLTYSPTLTVLWDNYATSSGFHVEPETKLVALNPLLPSPKTVADIRLSTGVYGREYANCYLDAQSVGPCASVVNADRTNSHAYPYASKYRHTLNMYGGGILDGGTVTTNGGPPPTILPPLGSTIVFN